MSYEQARELVLALIASGRLPVSSFDVHKQKDWAIEVLNEINNYIKLFTEAKSSETTGGYSIQDEISQE